jgi:hypothetical protein
MSQADVHPAEYQFYKKQIIWGLVAIFTIYRTVLIGVGIEIGTGFFIFSAPMPIATPTHIL